jgi:small-conductance mechanosensitive channel
LESIIDGFFIVAMSIDLGGESDNGDSSGDIGGGQDSSGISSPYPLHPGLANFWDSILVSVISIAASIAAYFIIRHLLKRTADSLNLDKRELKGINSITKMILIVITIIIIIFQFSSVSGVAAGAISVAAGTIIGFSSRNTISNAIAGILLLSSRPFKIGDRIRTTEDDSLVGDVIEISLLYTKIKTVRNELVAIPNQTLLQRQIVNYSGLDILATTIEVSAVYDNNRNKIESLLVEAAKNTDGIITDNPTPFVLLIRFENYAAVYELRAYTNKPNEYLKIQSEIRKKIYDLFQTHELDLTIPQAQINVDNENENREEVQELTYKEHLNDD